MRVRKILLTSVSALTVALAVTLAGGPAFAQTSQPAGSGTVTASYFPFH
jgi:hypothetical protein